MDLDIEIFSHSILQNVNHYKESALTVGTFFIYNISCNDSFIRQSKRKPGSDGENIELEKRFI